MVSALTSRHLLTKFLITDNLYAKSLKRPQKTAAVNTIQTYLDNELLDAGRLLLYSS